MTTPRERPIIFTSESVRAILAGTKTQSRRVMKPQPYADVRQDGLVRGRTKQCHVWEPRKTTAWFDWGNGFDPMMWIDGPFREGDRLWVKETWRELVDIDLGHNLAAYRADGETLPPHDPEHSDTKWRSPLFMTRWASRLTLEIISVRVERLFDISEKDAIAEGVSIEETRTLTHRGAFAITWDTINKKRGYGWEGGTNPWLWALTFRLLTQGKIIP